MRRALIAAAAATVLTVTAGGAASAQSGDDPKPFGHRCQQENGVRFCPTRGLGGRVDSFDKVPLDVDVTLPKKGEGPFPTLVMLHGYGGSKEDFESDDPEGDGSTTYHYNNNFYAKRGYAVINYSARGFGDSCGSEGSREDEDCDDGYIHLADQRFEARDTQHLLGLLVDEGIVDRRKIGVTGISYGGGQSIELALLRDRIRKRDDSFAKWRSPDGKELSIAAAYPRWPWSDLVASLLPNGQFGDIGKPGNRDSRNPLGIAIITYVTGLYVLGQEEGFYCGEPPSPSPCDDEDADITAWYNRVLAGEPPDDFAREIADEIFEHHQGFGLPLDRPAPLLLQSGWTDDLFPPRESLRMYNALRAREDNADVALQFGDLGHSRGANEEETNRQLNDQGADFFNKLLRGKGSRPDKGSVTAFAQTCPSDDGESDGPFKADSWDKIHPRTIDFSSSVTQMAPANPPEQLGDDYDPIAGTSDSCKRSQDSAVNDAGTAVYKGEVSDGFRMIGLPTVTADISVGPPGANAFDGAQLDARLWDVAPNGGPQILISRGAYRIPTDTDGEVTFQLSGNAWCFAPGHTPKLQLLGTDDPYLRPTTGPDTAYTVTVESMKVKLPAQSGSCGD